MNTQVQITEKTTQLVSTFVATIGNITQTVVNARELHTFLDNQRQFTDWIKQRIEQYGFLAGQDFESFSQKSEKPKGGRSSIEYHLTLDMAKELSMVENNEKGREARRYFIAMEKKAIAELMQPTFDLTETLSQTLNQISKGNKKLYMSMYNGLTRRFAVGRLADIPHAEINNALATIYFFAVEWHRKNTPTQLPLKLNDGEHYLVVKNGVVLWERKLKPNCNDIPANTLQNPKLMLEHIREVVGEFVGKEALPAPKPQNSETVRELVERVLIQNFTLTHIWKSLHALDKGLYLRAINYVVNTNVRVLRVIEDFGFKTKQGNDMISCDFRTIQLYDGRTITGCNPNYFNAFS